MFPLRVRSSYSLMQGTSCPEALCQRARELGYKGLALTDRNNLYGLWRFLKGCRENGLKAIIGAEISEPNSKRLITCLVQNEKGYKNLCQLISARQLKKDFCLTTDVPSLAEGLVILSSDVELIRGYLAARLLVAADLGCRPTANGRLLRLFAEKHRILAVVTVDSDLGQKKERDLHRLVQAIAEGRCLDPRKKTDKNDEVNYLRCQKDYSDIFSVWPEALGATEKLAALCPFTGPDFGVVMPPWRGARTDDAVAALREKAYNGARQRYGDDLGEEVVERLEHELRIIKDMGFSSYFLVVRDIVHRKKKDGTREMRRICGRGSGAASLVAYSLMITNVCPVKYNLYFERFLNPERKDPPDIDIDFSWDERDEVIQDVLADFKGHAAMVCNHVFFQPRMAIRETAKVFGLPGYEISRFTGKIPYMHNSGGENLHEKLSCLPALRDQDLSEPWPEVLRLAEELIGLPRYLSVHPGGVVITPAPIDHYVPVQMAEKGVPIIQWEKDATEEAGLVKIDLLGNRSLGVIRDAVAAVQQKGVVLEENLWHPEEDRETKLAVAAGKTMGCFYIESPAMRLLEQKAGTGDFEQLVIQSSIIRPAANEFVREYVRRLHGGTWQPLCQEIGDILDETFGLMVYQEDVSKVAVALAGFSHGEGDGLRKVLSKKDKVVRLREYKDKFFAGCRRNSVAEQEIERMWEMMMSFDGYSFCKPHSASYARVSFQAAYLKCHYPAQFMAAVISNGGGYYSIFAYVSEAKRMGLKVLPPSVVHSELCWSGEGDEIRVGLMAVHGLSEKFLGRILSRRKQRIFQSEYDFFLRTSPADNEARALIHAGALDDLAVGQNRTVLLWQWASFLHQKMNRSSDMLFQAPLSEAPVLPAPDRRTLLRREYRVLGFLCGHHPLEFLHPANVKRGQTAGKFVRIQDLQKRIGQRVFIAAWLLTGKLISTKTGEVMEFLTFEDETAIVEATFFPDIYKKYANILQSGRGYRLLGLVEEDFGALTFTVEALQPITVSSF
ncbi:DNA polymerase III subunit alpha [Desulforhopalus sp. IMCC35007]|nr:DNA polymerase III subunit alpha [Desulforhopalus sp. IMCC35007]